MSAHGLSFTLYAVDQSQRTVPSDQSQQRAHGKEGFRETDASNCFARVVYESFRNEVKLNRFFEKTKVFFDLGCM